MKFFIAFALVALVAVASGREICAGCPLPMDVQEAEGVLETTLTQLDSMDGPYYKFSAIHSATKQIVAGVLYSMNVDLIDAENKLENCNVVIVEQAWLGNTEVTFKCPNKSEVTKTIHTKN